MCKKATCARCSKSSWWGCGQHIPSIMDSVPENERCQCEPKTTVDGKSYPPKAEKAD
ncbi:hypothetical protein BDY17DRAFT_258841 [Neohortaea acidophila]|uniref:Uncharacterized protein n=1 Tax=Neohortaea acidophila TaxID=245834 RepID=A0A6A6PFG4_9PEZI|nr:uncharacterized protein BDY17DRAFT_258841 [Neohortaea acidophila]KAF2478506.1 hypothetical protein BDY17DRAFT_258841 [Neohortaea acidophila]